MTEYSVGVWNGSDLIHVMQQTATSRADAFEGAKTRLPALQLPCPQVRLRVLNYDGKGPFFTGLASTDGSRLRLAA